MADYERRTSWKHEPIRGSFPTADGLRNKVSPDGSYAAFCGSTVVFKPPTPCLQAVQQMQGALHGALDGSKMLADRLPASTTHLTLHDLVSPETSLAKTAEAYDREVANSIARAADVARAIWREHAGKRIAMVPDRIANMASKSLVLMLRPQAEKDFALLEELYHRFDGIQNLPYPLTPHVTLAYYRPGMLNADLLGAAVDHIKVRPKDPQVFEFHPEGLTVQRFLDMRTYADAYASP